MSAAFFEVMKIDVLRFNFCKYRWYLLRRRLRIIGEHTSSVGANAIEYNLDAFAQAGAVFGMAKRMSLLLYPVAALLRGRPEANVLIVGPRTEDDIIWAKSLGLRNTRGLDLFTYSKWIDLGDIHNTQMESASLDAVLLGWMISYSKDPTQVIAECKRLLRPGGYLGIGIETNPAQKAEGIRPPRVNHINSSGDLVDLVKERVVFIHDPELNVPYECAVIFRICAMPGLAY